MLADAREVFGKDYDPIRHPRKRVIQILGPAMQSIELAKAK